MVDLVPLSTDHLDLVMTWVNDPAVMGYFANRQTEITREEEAKYLESLIASKTDLAYSIFDDDEYVGQCSINQVYWPARNGRLFIAIRKDCQGEGYGPEAVEQLLNLAWTSLGLHKVWLIVREDNRRAQAMYLKLGFAFEGTLKDEYHVGGKFYNMVRMGAINPTVGVAEEA